MGTVGLVPEGLIRLQILATAHAKTMNGPRDISRSPLFLFNHKRMNEPSTYWLRADPKPAGSNLLSGVLSSPFVARKERLPIGTNRLFMTSRPSSERTHLRKSLTAP